MREPAFEIVHEDADLLLVNKEPGLVCHPTKGDAHSSLIGRLRLYLGPESPVHLVHRLDRETSGIVLVAKHKEAARDLGITLQARQAKKTYLGIVHGRPHPEFQLVDAPTGKDEASQVVVKDCVRPDGAPARTELSTLNTWSTSLGTFSLLRLRPETGRKHQIRIHLAHIGHPLVGDKLYGGNEAHYLDFVAGRQSARQRDCLILQHHALHAWRLELDWRGKCLSFEAKPHEDFLRYCQGGGITWSSPFPGDVTPATPPPGG